MLRRRLARKNKTSEGVETMQDRSKVHDNLCCGENMREYLRSTSIHGLKYIGNNNLTLFER